MKYKCCCLRLLLLQSLLSSLGLLALSDLGGCGLDDTDSHGLPHVAHGEAAEGRELGERLHTRRLAGQKLDNGCVTRLDELGIILGGFTGTAINLLLYLGELARNVSRMTVEDRAIAVGDLTGMVQHDDLSGEIRHAGGRLVLGVGSYISTLDVLNRDVLDVESNVVSRDGFGKRLVMHFHRLDLSGQLVGGEGHHDAGLDDSGLHTAHGHCSNTADFVYILKGQPERLVSWSCGWDDGVERLQQSGTAGLALLPLHTPALVPGHLLAGLQHVITVPARD